MGACRVRHRPFLPPRRRRASSKRSPPTSACLRRRRPVPPLTPLPPAAALKIQDGVRLFAPTASCRTPRHPSAALDACVAKPRPLSPAGFRESSSPVATPPSPRRAPHVIHLLTALLALPGLAGFRLGSSSRHRRAGDIALLAEPPPGSAASCTCRCRAETTRFARNVGVDNRRAGRRDGREALRLMPTSRSARTSSAAFRRDRERVGRTSGSPKGGPFSKLHVFPQRAAIARPPPASQPVPTDGASARPRAIALGTRSRAAFPALSGRPWKSGGARRPARARRTAGAASTRLLVRGVRPLPPQACTFTVDAVCGDILHGP
jgi:hypothetical protein